MGLDCTLWRLPIYRLKELMNSYEALDALICGEDEAIEADSIYLGKAWHILHYCITGETKGGVLPLSYAIMAGYPIAEDYIDGVIFLTPDDVSEVSEALSRISEKEIIGRFKDEAIGNPDIYCSQWNEDDFDKLLGFFNGILHFYQEASLIRNIILRHIG